MKRITPDSLKINLVRDYYKIQNVQKLPQTEQANLYIWCIHNLFQSHSVLLTYIPIVLKIFSYELFYALINVTLNPLISFCLILKILLLETSSKYLQRLHLTLCVL